MKKIIIFAMLMLTLSMQAGAKTNVESHDALLVQVDSGKQVPCSLEVVTCLTTGYFKLGLDEYKFEKFYTTPKSNYGYAVRNGKERTFVFVQYHKEVTLFIIYSKTNTLRYWVR